MNGEKPGTADMVFAFLVVIIPVVTVAIVVFCGLTAAVDWVFDALR